MTLCALDSKGNLVRARDQLPRTTYRCLECHGALRLRSGETKRPHFYHLKPSSECRQSSKSEEHLQTQLYIQRQIGEANAFLEQRFPKINRIADVCWPAQKLIFEVQCSPIKREELEQRNADYASEGYQVVWIFHTQNFFKYKLTGAEASVRRRPHYYTNMRADGRGRIFDPCVAMRNGMRVKRLGNLTVDISRPVAGRRGPASYVLPGSLRERHHCWSHWFAGDVISTASDSRGSHPLIRELQAAEPLPRSTELRPLWKRLPEAILQVINEALGHRN